MSYKLLFTIVIYVQVCLLAHGQVLKGTVRDAENKQPLSGVNIEVTPVNKYTSTDSDGFFKITDIKSGRYSLKVSLLGYESAVVKEVLIIAGKEERLEILLLENIKYLEEITVRSQKEYGAAQNEMATVSAKSFTVEQTKRYAASWGDPARMALSFAGVSNVNDQTNEIIIRGNSPKGMLWRIEGMEVSNPNHFGTDGASGGGYCGISPNVLANSDFYTGAFPAEYGNALSGVFDIRLRNGNNEKKEYSFQAGFQGIEASIEGPFNNSKASYLVNYRYPPK